MLSPILPSPTDAEVDTYLDAVVARIVEVADPLRIVLFGSRARGDHRPDSDLDLLVFLPDGVDRRAEMRRIGSLLPPRPVGVDLIVTTPALWQRQKDDPGLIYWTAEREGTPIYEKR
jgi:predicted nucleotidyltransferase